MTAFDPSESSFAFDDSSRIEPIDRAVVGRLRYIGRSSSGNHKDHKVVDWNLRDDERSEQVIKHHLSELNIQITTMHLDSIVGYMVSEKGYRSIVVSDELDTATKVFLYLHIVGHIALGHVDESSLCVTYEVHARGRLPSADRVKEYQADRWALRLVESALNRDDRESSLKLFLSSVRNLVVPKGALRRMLHLFSAMLYENASLYRRLRDTQWTLRQDAQDGSSHSIDRRHRSHEHI